MANATIDAKLRSNILPYLLMPELLKRTGYYRTHVFMTYTTLIVGAVAGIGITSPLADLVRGQSVSIDFAKTSVQATVLAWTFAVAWVIVKAVYDHNSWSKHAALAASCQRAFRKCEDDLERILDQKEPLPDLNALYARQVEPMVDQLVQEGALPYKLLDIRRRLAKLINETADDLAKRYGGMWADAPPDERKAPPPPAAGSGQP